MTWPLIERELRVALRKRQLHQLRVWGTLLCAGIATLFLLSSTSVGGGNWGINFNTLLFWGGLLCIFRVPAYTVGIFAEERRNETLGLLFLCGIRPIELFLSKTLGAALVSFSSLTLLYPFFAISFLGGGLSVGQFVAVATSLPVLLLFVFSVCVLASVLCREESTAMFLASVLGAVFTIAPLIVHLLVSPTPVASSRLLAFSPVGPAYLAGTRLSQGTMAEFWLSAAFSICASGSILLLAGSTLSRVWQDKPQVGESTSWHIRFRKWLKGDLAWRKRLLFTRWHEVNPFVWLAARDRFPALLAWIVTGSVTLLWLLTGVVWPKLAFCPMAFYSLVLLLNASLGWISTYAAAKPIGDNRRSGGLELLLTTPLHHLDIVRGQLVALQVQFRPVAKTVLTLEVLLCGIGFSTRDWSLGSLVIYLLIWAALIGWTSTYLRSFRNTLPVFWDSLVCGRPAYVALKKAGVITSPAWVAYLIFIGGQAIQDIANSRMNAFPAGTFGEYVFCGIGLIALVIFRLPYYTTLRNVEARLATDMRAIAATPPPEPADPRYKDWKSGEHFPEMFSEMLVNRLVRNAREAKTRTATGN